MYIQQDFRDEVAVLTLSKSLTTGMDVAPFQDLISNLVNQGTQKVGGGSVNGQLVWNSDAWCIFRQPAGPSKSWRGLAVGRTFKKDGQDL